MDDDLNAFNGGVDALARCEVTGHELGTLSHVDAPTEHPDGVPFIAQPRDDEPSERARAAGHQDGWGG